MPPVKWVANLVLLAVVIAIPSDWNERVQAGHMLYTDQEPQLQLMASIGSGYLATTINSDTVYVSNLYNGYATSTPSHRARIPSTVRITVQGASLSGAALDFERAVYYRRLSFGGAAIEQRWYAPRNPGNLLVHEIDVTAGSSAVTLSLSSDPGAASTDILFTNVSSDPVGWFGAINQTEYPDSQKVQVAVVSTPVPASITVPAGVMTTYYFVTAISTDMSSDCQGGRSPMDCASDAWSAASRQPETLLPEHLDAWQQIWQSRIEVGGRLELAQAINASMYYLLSSVRQDGDATLSPGGLASNAYNGHVFWDMDTWMYPSLLMLHPDIAQNLLYYRYQRLAGAQLKAQSYNKGYKGAMFPWESAFTGQEVCPSWAPTGALEQHISGDISFAFMQYWRVTQDKQWLSDIAWPVMSQIAQFWASRVVQLPSHNNMYGILYVIPPDEYAVNVSNSAYTNVIASMALQFATEVAGLLGEQADPEWMEIANNMWVPMDSNKGIHLEYEGYNGQKIKQADVVLLGYPLMYPMSPTVRAADLAYYGPRTDSNGPAMTWGMHAVAYLELGQAAQAASLFNRSYANIHPPFNIWMETPTGGAVNFLTGAGGFLQGVLGGYGGIRILDTQLDMYPQLFQNSNFVAIRRFQYMAALLDIEFDSNATTITLRGAGARDLVATGASQRCVLTSTAPCVFPSMTHISIAAI